MESQINIVLQLCKDNIDGITNDMIKDSLDIEMAEAGPIINKLLQKKKITMLKNGNGQLFYKLQQSTKKFDTREAQILYEAIERRGSKGIGMGELLKTNMRKADIKSTADKLERKKYIKSLKKGIQRFYILYELEPDEDVFGGPFYLENGSLDVAQVTVLSDRCKLFMDKKALAAVERGGDPLTVHQGKRVTVKEVTKFINDKKILKRPAGVSSIHQILESLARAGRATSYPCIEQGEDMPMYRSLPDPGNDIDSGVSVPLGMTATPCGVCPYIKRCQDIGEFTPRTCNFLQDWLQLF